jgi:hypothetical protein
LTPQFVASRLAAARDSSVRVRAHCKRLVCLQLAVRSIVLTHLPAESFIVVATEFWWRTQDRS